ncbi:P-protein [Cytospora mali]|uniref:prephenate dehydratase n=1 Tax=Cytospora mali TaxID=578113 RepID=A0A194VNT3_CYTMA|nr:P-protein [Valsa mali]
MTAVHAKEEGGISKEKPLVAFLGPLSSYTHQATKSAFPEQTHEYTPVATIKDVFEAVAAGDADYGVVPFENSTHGVVTFTLGCLADRADAYGDLSVCGEVYIDPECDLSHVRRIYSHPQAFGQTQAFLSAHLRGVEAVDVSSTSKAAELASRDETGATAAVAGAVAAEAFGLDVLARCIQDRDDNTTRFFVLRRKGGGAKAEEKEKEGTRQQDKSLVSFTVPHKAPGALASVLDVFRTYGLNLTSINSLPSLIQPFQYLFFVEFEGSRYHDPEGKVKAALEEVDRVAESWRWLGSWERQR